MSVGYAARNMPAFNRSRVIFSTHGIRQNHHLGDFCNALYTRKAEETFSIKVDAEISAMTGVAAVMTYTNQIRYGETPPIMLDIKLGDMPKVVAEAAKTLGEVHQPVAFTVNPSSGLKSLQAAVANKGACLVVVSTVNTSLDDNDCLRIYNRPRLEQVFVFAEMAAEAGADAVIIGGWEVKELKARGISPKLAVYCAGVRPDWHPDAGNNWRTVTPTQAFQDGADKIIIGDPVLSQKGPLEQRAAALRIIHEVNDALRVPTLV